MFFSCINPPDHDIIKDGFLNPPDSARPGVYWYFMDGNLDRAAMTADLESMKKAGIEGLISHLKHDHRMLRNYLSGTAGDQINTILAAAAYNMRKWMRLKREELLNLIFCLFSRAYILVPVNIKS